MLEIRKQSRIVASLIVLAAPASAQLPTGTISGDIKDSSGGALPGVTVTITSQDRGFSRSTGSDDTGRFLFPALPIGPYRVEATLQGFETSHSADNIVESDKTTNVPFTMKVGALTDVVEVVGDIPVVDITNASGNTRVGRDEFEKLPVGRSYNALLGTVSGVIASERGGNYNSLGALDSNNLFIIDGVDTTDPTTGTFGTTLNFEAIQEVSVYSSGASAEYGRAQGAIVNVITRSGTNRFEGSAKHIFLNDRWDAQNKTVSEVSGASLARSKFDRINPVWTFTGGGPLWKNRAWFFGAYEWSKNTSPQQQTVGQIPEDYRSKQENNFSNLRGTLQLRRGHTAWVKYFRSPTTGIVRDNWGAAGEREALTLQSQTAEHWAAQWSGVVNDIWSMEASVADYRSLIEMMTFEESGRLSNAPISNEGDNKFYNGATFDGFVERPRQQFNVASNWFLAPGGRSHDLKVGFDFQDMESGSSFRYPNAQLYTVESYSQATGAFVPLFRQDFETGASVSTGKIFALFARDKFRLTSRFFLAAGLRWEKQTGESDVGVNTVDTNVISPRLSGSFDLAGDGKTLVTASYGRYYANIIQGFSDSFANVPQVANYDLYAWNGSQYAFLASIRVGASDFQPNLELKPSHMDEVTISFQRQFGRSIGAGVRFVGRKWDNIIDDTRRFRPNGSIERLVVNYDNATRNYKGVQFTLERRFSNNWYAQGSYTLSRTSGNHFGVDNFTTLGDFLEAQCRTTLDLTIGTNGVIPCAEVQEGPNKTGRPPYDRPHNFKLNGAYVRPIGPVNLTVGALTESVSKRRYERQRGVNVLRPGTTTNSGQTATYFYEERGAFQIPGLTNFIDLSAELTWRIASTHQAGFKTEIFNVGDNQEKTITNNVAWCGSAANATCTTAIDRFGKASARGSFLAPRRYRFSVIYRF